MAGLNERSKNDFLVYANSVIKSRAIPSIEDNLKPIHRRILWSMYENKYYNDKPTVKCARVVGNVMGSYHPHGDSSIYEALVRLSQWWKIRYPLVELQGNGGNLLGDGAAASRYTECRLTKVGMMLLEDIEKNCVDTRPNFDESTTEPVSLPSKFPYLLCGNNSGIAVGMSSDLVSHNFTEVMGAINYYMDHKDCSIADLMQFIKGPDFPTGGLITNGEELLNIYSTGRGSIKVYSHYEISKKGAKTVITFKDIPYGVEIDSGVKAPLKKLVLDDGYDIFEDIDVRKAGPRNFDILVTLSKNADVAKALEILFAKTRLCDSIKINQTVLVNGEPKLLNLKELIAYWVNYRSDIIKKIAATDYQKTNHKLTVTLGLQKCMSDIDLLVNLIRNSDNRAAAKIAIMKAFELNDEQADAVLDMKLSKLSRLDLTELNDEEKNLRETLAKLKDTIDNEENRYNIIREQLKEIKGVLGKDERLTEIQFTRPIEGLTTDEPLIKKEWQIYRDGLHGSVDGTTVVTNDLVDVVFAYGPEDIYAYSADGELGLISELAGKIEGAAVKDSQKKVVAVTANGNIKVSSIEEYKLKKSEKVMKLKDGDSIKFVGFCDDDDFLMLYDGNAHILKLAIKDLPVASKMTLGVKSGFTTIASAAVVKDNSLLLFATSDNKGKFTAVKDFTADSRGNKGQLVPENTKYMRLFDENRENIYLIPKQGNAVTLARNKLSVKGRTAIGASMTSRAVIGII